jgi:hypothetical protein
VAHFVVSEGREIFVEHQFRVRPHLSVNAIGRTVVSERRELTLLVLERVEISDMVRAALFE